MPIEYNSEKDEIIVSSEYSITFDDIYAEFETAAKFIEEETVVWKNNPNENANENAFKEKIKTKQTLVEAASKIKKCENGFIIDCNLRLKENTNLWTENQYVRINGSTFQIEPWCSFRMGKRTADGQYKSGSYLYMPNPALAYGFGGNDLYDDATNSGNIYLYDSKIDVRCFWGFFAGPNQRVEIEHCNVNGFGRIEGSTSIVDHVYFTEAHSKYGILSPKGTLKKYENISVLKSTDCAVYFNPALSGDMIIRGGKFDGYKNLVYAEPSDQRLIENDSTITFVDADIPSKNYKMTYGRNTHISVNYTFDPIFYDKDKRILTNLFVCILDQYGDIRWEGYTNAYGRIDGKINLPAYSNNFRKEAKDYNPYKVVVKGVNNDNVEIDHVFKFDHLVPWKKQPLVIPPKGEVEYIEVEGPGNTDNTVPDDWIIDVNIDPNAPTVIYVNGPNDKYNNDIKSSIKEAIGDISKTMPVYTDKTKDAYDSRPSYDRIMKLALMGKIKKIYTWEPETFGVSRKDLTMELFSLMNIDMIFVKHSL